MEITRISVQKSSSEWVLKSGLNELKIHQKPFYIEAFSEGEKVAVINGRQTLKFEHLRQKPDV